MIDVKTYIENELEYDSVKNNENGVLDYLNSLTDEDINKIEDNVRNDIELQDLINGIIDWHLYHYKTWGKEEE